MKIAISFSIIAVAICLLGTSCDSAEQDLHCADGKELHQAVQAIKAGYDEYQKYAYLQYETMDHHEEVAPGITVTSFSNGHQIVVNYTSLPYTYQQTIIPPYNWQLVK